MGGLGGFAVHHIEPVVGEAGQIAALFGCIVAFRHARARDMHIRTARLKAVRDTVADPARPANDQRGFAGEIQRIKWHGKSLPS